MTTKTASPEKYNLNVVYRRHLSSERFKRATAQIAIIVTPRVS